MSKFEFGSVFKFFGGGQPTAEEKQQLFRETMVMTLARATSSDTNPDPVEIAAVVKLLKEEIGEDVSEADIRVAAASELWETKPLQKVLSKAGSKLDPADRVRVVNALAHVIKSDVRVSQMEVDFFNMVAAAISVTPAELAGLIPAQ